MPLLLVVLLLMFAVIIYMFKSGPTLSAATNEMIDAVLKSDLPEIIQGQTGFASSGGLKIWYESITPDGPSKGTVVLIMGSGGDALGWPPQFVRAFLDANYHVIRYDQRSTGMSDWIKDWDRKNPYSLSDMANDVMAILNTLEIKKAHLVGLSMGGMIAQEAAIYHPDKVASLTLMMTSGYIGDPDLPNVTSRYFLEAMVKGIPLLKYRLQGGEKNLIKERIAKTMLVVAEEDLNVKEVAEVVLYDLRKRRGIHIQGVFQHQAAVSASGSRYEHLKTLNVPTLIIHGTADQLIPFPHGQRLAELIPNAKHLWLEGVGHVFPPPHMNVWMKTILAHLDAS